MAYNDEFANGIVHEVAEGRDNSSGSLSLQQAGESWTSQVLADSRRPNSVLDPYGFSPNQSANGTADTNWQPGLGSLGSGNGMSTQTFDENLNLRFLGRDQDAELD